MDKLENYLEIVQQNPIALGVVTFVIAVILTFCCCCCAPQKAKGKKSKTKSKKSGGNAGPKAQAKYKAAYETVKICKYCRIKICDDSAWKSHVVSKKHLKNTDETDKDRCLVDPDELLTPEEVEIRMKVSEKKEKRLEIFGKIKTQGDSKLVLNNFLLKSGSLNLLRNFAIYYSFIKPKLVEQIMNYFNSFNPKAKNVNILSYDPFSPKRGYGLIQTGTLVISDEQKQKQQKEQLQQKQKNQKNDNTNNPYFLPVANQLLKSLISQLHIPSDIQYNCCDIYICEEGGFIPPFEVNTVRSLFCCIGDCVELVMGNDIETISDGEYVCDMDLYLPDRSVIRCQDELSNGVQRAICTVDSKLICFHYYMKQ